ncbi:protein takeout-like [Haematobia irritans]|uniref:protein takeout-like n=1 Tax=Haematobia irritans TaxID=7368 RepID=UPI003F5076E2
MITKSFSLIFITIAVVKGSFPDDPKPCKYEDSECIMKLFDYFVGEKFSGDESLGLKMIDPLPLKNWEIGKGGDSPVNIKFIVHNGTGAGLRSMRAKKVKGFGKDIAVNHEIISEGDVLVLTGDYTISGKVLLLPLSGTGKCNVTFIKPQLTIGWTGIPYEKNGDTYMKLDKFYHIVRLQGASFQFDNLYNNEALSDNMNKFMTENWKEIFSELAEPIQHGFGVIFHKYISKIFAKYPYNKILTD